MVLLQSKKIPNWKAPGPDGVQGYWIKKLILLHERIAEQTNDMINNGVQTPEWMTSGRTVLCQKDPKEGNAVDNHRPISCLPLMWKLMVGQLRGRFVVHTGNFCGRFNFWFKEALTQKMTSTNNPPKAC